MVDSSSSSAAWSTPTRQVVLRSKKKLATSLERSTTTGKNICIVRRNLKTAFSPKKPRVEVSLQTLNTTVEDDDIQAEILSTFVGGVAELSKQPSDLDIDNSQRPAISQLLQDEVELGAPIQQKCPPSVPSTALFTIEVYIPFCGIREGMTLPYGMSVHEFKVHLLQRGLVGPDQAVDVFSDEDYVEPFVNLHGFASGGPVAAWLLGSESDADEEIVNECEPLAVTAIISDMSYDTGLVVTLADSSVKCGRGHVSAAAAERSMVPNETQRTPPSSMCIDVFIPSIGLREGMVLNPTMCISDLKSYMVARGLCPTFELIDVYSSIHSGSPSLPHSLYPLASLAVENKEKGGSSGGTASGTSSCYSTSVAVKLMLEGWEGEDQESVGGDEEEGEVEWECNNSCTGLADDVMLSQLDSDDGLVVMLRCPIVSVPPPPPSPAAVVGVVTVAGGGTPTIMTPLGGVGGGD